MSAPLNSAIDVVLANISPRKPGSMATIATLLDKHSEKAADIGAAHMGALTKNAKVNMTTSLGVTLASDDLTSLTPSGPNKPSGRGR